MTTRLAVRVHPGARRRAVRGWLADGTLKLEVDAPPEGGRANQAVVELLAEVLDVRKSQVRVTRGLGSRSKRVEVDGLAAADVRARIDAKVEADGE